MMCQNLNIQDAHIQSSRLNWKQGRHTGSFFFLVGMSSSSVAVHALKAQNRTTTFKRSSTSRDWEGILQTMGWQQALTRSKVFEMQPYGLAAALSTPPSHPTQPT